MPRSIRLPIAFLFAFTTFISFSFSFKENNISTKAGILACYNDSSSTETFISDKHANTKAPDTYTVMNLEKKGLSKKAFDLALKGYNNLIRKKVIRNKNIITVIDFSKPSSQKRLYVIDLKRNKVLFQSLVAHGRNSGLDYATNFSNENDSHKSSLGFYVTLNTYSGECGYALKLKGCERGFNDQAYNRAIVMHGSEYVTEQFLKSNGFLGRSFGCPALPAKMNKKIIDVIKNGSCLFLYHPTQKYLLTSPVLHG
ncbi:MAG: murein L,D-transpeptidase catalytic domain family protein [Chitinophagaceae bacterium]|nr:murein L,D-transpeptidase catalytic domain family protein [Ferruginibacter sp.]MDB5223031.1 murein L,D-transpeptidase catalytic domain family protein [Chitinophagaceae bacterium]